MRYKVTHPKKVRGVAVHQTGEEKMKEEERIRQEFGDIPPEIAQEILDKKYVTANGRVIRGSQIYKGAKKRFMDGHSELAREAIEATYLIPKVDHFVETPEVKRIKERARLWIKVGYPVHLIGPTGCGKTTLAMNVAKELGRPVVWINGDESVTTTDLIGGYSQVEAESLRDRYIHNVFKSRDILKADWVDNPLALACKYGYTLVYNEFSRTKPEANNILLSVFEEKILELPTKFGEERYVRVHPDFNAVLTSNSVEYAGVHRPQDALLDRMIGIYMDFYDFDTEVKIVRAHTGILAKEAKKIVGVVRTLREKLPDAQKPGTRACIMIAQGLRALDGHSAENLKQLCVDIVATKTSSPADLLENQRLVEDALRADIGATL
ncbi:MAG: gas vesicle protein GvpN [Candidatus Hydrothermarchaeota archaeon]|nr:gas vesicle protein GvpN [Candidatus Hydrothermarchaeota archaeon]